MSKTKSTTKSSKADAKKAAPVKEGRVTKPAQSTKSKSKDIAKSTADKVKKSKKAKKEPTPEPESSDSESESEADSDSSSSSEEEAPAKAPVKAKANGAAKAAAESSDSSDSSDDSSDSEEEAPKAKTNGAAKPAAKDDSDSDSDSDSSDSDEEVPTKAVKDVKMADASDSDSDSESGSDSSDSDSSESEEAEAPSKKRKAEDEAEPVQKKAKTEDEGIKNLFVGNLSWNVDEDWLAREFEGFGEIVGCRIISDRDTQRSKGFGYVEFASAESAAKAKAEMHGKDVDNRALNVDFSTPRANNPKEKSNDRAARFGDKPSTPSNTLFIGNLSFDSTNDSIHEAFSAFGEISRVSLPTDRDTGNPKGFGYVDFNTVEEAKAALESMSGADVDGRNIRVDYATPRDDSAGGGRGGRGGFGDRGGRGGGRGGFGGRGGGRGGRGGFGDRGGRGGGRGGRGGFSTNRGGFGDFKGSKMTF